MDVKHHVDLLTCCAENGGEVQARPGAGGQREHQRDGVPVRGGQDPADVPHGARQHRRLHPRLHQAAQLGREGRHPKLVPRDAQHLPGEEGDPAKGTRGGEGRDGKGL